MALRLFVALLLATIGLHAVPSGNLPLERDHGSAFSAHSIDSAVARQLDRIQVATVAQPMPPPLDRDGAGSRLAAIAVGEHARFAKATPGLPTFAIASPPYLPRPPPLA